MKLDQIRLAIRCGHAMAPFMHRANARFAFLLAPVLLSACASGGTYPSLALRDVERVAGSGQPAPGEATPAPVLPPASADLQARLAGLVEAANKAHAGFVAKRGGAQSAVSRARGSGVASESWIAAQVAIADLISLRSSAVTALAELDQIYVAQRYADSVTETPSAEAIASALAKVEAMVDEENATLDSLGSRLR